MTGDIDKSKDLYTKMQDLAQYNGDDRIVSFAEAYEYHKAEGEKRDYFYSTFKSLNNIIKGFLPGQLIVISGPTGEGKTTLCQTFTDYFATADINCQWFSYELTAFEFLNKFPEIPKAYMPLDRMDNNLEWITDRIIEGIVKYKTQIVFIDHLHYLISLSQRVNMSLVIGDIMRKLKLIAINHSVVLFLIAHLQKIKVEELPTLSDLRDSSFIGQEADKVMMIWRTPEEEKKKGEKIYFNKATLSVVKDRQTGKRGYIHLSLKNNLFREECDLWTENQI